MQIAKPWVMYKTIEEIGQAIQQGLMDALQVPVGIAIQDEEFLVLLQFPGSQAHLKFELESLKSDYKSVESFVTFIVDCYEESMKEQ
jgi:flagellar basal body rod protein FlgF